MVTLAKVRSSKIFSPKLCNDPHKDVLSFQISWWRANPPRFLRPKGRMHGHVSDMLVSRCTSFDQLGSSMSYPHRPIANESPRWKEVSRSLLSCKDWANWCKWQTLHTANDSVRMRTCCFTDANRDLTDSTGRSWQGGQETDVTDVLRNVQQVNQRVPEIFCNTV